MVKIKKEEIKELKKELTKPERRIEREIVNIIEDKRQVSIRIPKKFVYAADINPHDKFKFILIIPKEKGKDVELRGELIKNK